MSFSLDNNEHKQKTTSYFHPALFYCYQLLERCVGHLYLFSTLGLSENSS